MLLKDAGPRVSDAAIEKYLAETLGSVSTPRVWAGVGALPYFLQDAFETREMSLHDRPVLLAIARRRGSGGLAEVRTHVEKLRTLSNLPVVYVTDALASYERTRLIRQRVPFLVPGNQLYLPDLGIDLREYFRQGERRVIAAALSPATQALLIGSLLREPWRSDWDPSPLMARLGYTPMTLTRAVRELAAAGILAVTRRGRRRVAHTDRGPWEIWELARPLLRSPVKRRVWVAATDERIDGLYVAGESALARLSSLGAPRWPVYAIGPAPWKLAVRAGIRQLPEPEEACQAWQVWSYDPGLQSDAAVGTSGGIVDPLSLALSLQHDTDERVQIALDELRRSFPW